MEKRRAISAQNTSLHAIFGQGPTQGGAQSCAEGRRGGGRGRGRKKCFSTLKSGKWFHPPWKKNWAQLDLDASHVFSASAHLCVAPPEPPIGRSTGWSRDSTLHTAHYTSVEWADMEARPCATRPRTRTRTTCRIATESRRPDATGGSGEASRMEGSVGGREQPEQRPLKSRTAARRRGRGRAPACPAIAGHNNVLHVVQAQLRPPATPTSSRRQPCR